MKISSFSPHILLIDDDTRIRNLLKRYLNENGFFVSTLESTKNADQLINQIKTDLIILDLMLPEENGVDFAKRVRPYNNIPIVMLTAKGEVEDKITGLETGADDYIIKPFEPKELLLRIKNILKRSATQENKDIIKFSNFKYIVSKNLLFKNDIPISLSTSENILLKLLLKHKNHILSREYLSNHLGINERSVDVQIVRLRGKIEENHNQPIYLQTIRGKGYIFNI